MCDLYLPMYRLSLQLLLLPRSGGRFERHRLFLLALCDRRRLVCEKHPDCSESLGCQCDDAGARDAPDIDAHAAQRCAWEAQYPLDVVWYPASRHIEHGRLGEPELQNEAEALGAEPAEGGDCRRECCLVGAEGAICTSLVSTCPTWHNN
jgi:hypothetical protein